MTSRHPINFEDPDPASSRPLEVDRPRRGSTAARESATETAKTLEGSVLEPSPTADPVVLVVDDDPAALKSLRRCFRHEPFDLITANSGDEALSWMAEFPVDLLIADQKMPDMTGTELLHLVQRQFPGTACAILTAFRTPTLMEESRDAGACAILDKPWDEQTLRNTIRDLLGKKPGRAGDLADPR